MGQVGAGMNWDTDPDEGDGESGAMAGAATLAEGELRCGGLRWPIAGRTLRLMLWLATRQQRINAVASESGQLWITWKGSGPHSIDGEVKTRLSGE
jgi:hypothetical protein